MRSCIVEGCSDRLYSHAMCRLHYEAWKSQRWDSTGVRLVATAPINYPKPVRREDLTGQRIGATLIVRAMGPVEWECICTLCGQVFRRRHSKLLQARRLSRNADCGECRQLVTHAQRVEKREERKRARELSTSEAENIIFQKLEREYKRESSRRGLQWSLTSKHLRALIFADCSYCGCRNKTGYVGIDRIDSDSYYRPDNVVSCCAICNRAKHTMSIDDWSKWLETVGLKRAS